MMDAQTLLQQLLLYGAILTAILALLKGLSDLFNILKPVLGPVFLVGSILFPHGLMIWCGMYLAAMNSDRIREGQVFLWLVIQLTLLASAYTFIWAKWIYPWITRWQKKQSKRSTKYDAEEN